MLYTKLTTASHELVYVSFTILDKHQNGSLSSRFIPRKKIRPITTESLEELEERVTIELHQMFDSWKNQIRDIEESEIITSV